MRDLLNVIDSVITEGVGLSNRRPGEKFKNNVDDIITFQGLEFFPNSGAYPAAELESAVAAAVDVVAAFAFCGLFNYHGDQTGHNFSCVK